MTGPPSPPDTFDADQREVWRRVFEQPQIERRDADVVAGAIFATSFIRQLLDQITTVREDGNGDRIAFDADEAIIEQLTDLGKSLEALQIPVPLARRLGLWPIGIEDAATAQRRRERVALRPIEAASAEFVAFCRERVAKYRHQAARDRLRADSDPSQAEFWREMAATLERMADEAENDLDQL